MDEAEEVFDVKGRPLFESIQDHRPADGTLVYFAFDLLILWGRSLLNYTLDERKFALKKHGVPGLKKPL